MYDYYFLTVLFFVLIIYGYVSFYGNPFKNKEPKKEPPQISILTIVLKGQSSQNLTYEGEPNFGGHHHVRRFAKWYFSGTTPKFTIEYADGGCVVIERDKIVQVVIKPEKE